jgi:hypothetical protein
LKNASNNLRGLAKGKNTEANHGRRWDVNGGPLIEIER